jgi:Glycosyltransferases involved in cell wall biogenesis
MMSDPKIQIYIMTYNRPDTISAAIKSVLSQTYQNIELIVSDNSTNDDTFNLLSELTLPKKYKYIRRIPPVSGVDHINTIIGEVQSDYFMIFHDDDEMLPNMVEELYKTVSVEKNCSAVASNAIILKRGKKSLYFHEKNIKVQNGMELLRLYNSDQMAPFPSYMYRRSSLNGIRLDYNHKGGKYCDVSFLFDIANTGIIIYVGRPLMIYNIHPGQDSGSFDYIKHVQLTNYLLRHIDNRRIIDNFRLNHIYKNVINDYQQRPIHIRKMVMELFVSYFSFVYVLKYLVRFAQSRSGFLLKYFN